MNRLIDFIMVHIKFILLFVISVSLLYKITESLSLDKIKIILEYIKTENDTANTVNDNVNNNVINNNNKHNVNNNDNKILLSLLQNNYTVNATIVKHSIIYNIKTQYYTGEVVLFYNNYYDNHYSCKIGINIPEQKTALTIRNYIYYNYNLGKIIKMTCNKYECVCNLQFVFNEEIAQYEKLEDIGKYDYDYFICNIIKKSKSNDEL